MKRDYNSNEATSRRKGSGFFFFQAEDGIRDKGM